jgi:hypothetical protein
LANVIIEWFKQRVQELVRCVDAYKDILRRSKFLPREEVASTETGKAEFERQTIITEHERSRA